MANPASLAFVTLFFYIIFFSAKSSLLYNGFKEGSLALDGAAVVESSRALRLTDTSQNIVGRAFYRDAFQMFNNTSRSYPNASSFSTTFVFAIDPSIPSHGGHGFAFVLAPSTSFEGAESGHFLGLFNQFTDGNTSNHIFSVEFDTVHGHEEVRNYRGNQVGININGLASVSSKHASSTYYFDEMSLDEIHIDSGDPIAVWIEYDGFRRHVNVTIGLLTDQKPEKPLLSCPIDLTPILMDQMFVGFSASTGIETSSHYILGWSFAVNAQAQQLRFSHLPKRPKKEHASSSNPHLKVVLAVSCIVAILGIVLLAFLFRRMRKAERLEDWEIDCPHRFNYNDLYKATNEFKDSQQIGIGGFGSVYRGVLRSTGAEIAVKRVKRNSSQGMKEFAAEIESLGRLRHKNLVHLQGWCKKNNDLLIVYDYIPNGSLHSLLYHPKHNLVLNWEQRFNILKGIAAGLLYLHEDWEQVVIHRDVKPSNVLIDSNMNARLSDFGLSRQYDHDQISHTTRVVGTIGYIPPELFRTGKASKSADVFAYGVLLLEVACGRKPLGSNQFVLVDWVMELYETGDILDAADAKLDLVYDVEEMEMVLQLGILCTQWKQEARPSMRQVTRFLNGEDPLPAVDEWACSRSMLEYNIRLRAEGTSAMSESSSPMTIGPVSSGSIIAGR